MSEFHRRSTELMHSGRGSVAGGVYFVTFVAAGRVPWLAKPTAIAGVLKTLRNWHDEGDGAVLAATVMPDHVHVLFELGTRLAVGRCVSRWKTGSRKEAGYDGAWQRDFWEHRVRSGEPWEDYGLYLFLNPYRAGLLAKNGRWPGWWVPEPKSFKFMGLLEPKGEPPQEWIEWPDDRFAQLATGE